MEMVYYIDVDVDGRWSVAVVAGVRGVGVGAGY